MHMQHLVKFHHFVLKILSVKQLGIRAWRTTWKQYTPSLIHTLYAGVGGVKFYPFILKILSGNEKCYGRNDGQPQNRISNPILRMWGYTKLWQSQLDVLQSQPRSCQYQCICKIWFNSIKIYQFNLKILSGNEKCYELNDGQPQNRISPHTSYAGV